jgi:hypothetical protein
LLLHHHGHTHLHPRKLASRQSLYMTIGPATSSAFSLPSSCSTSDSANSNAVPGPRDVVHVPSTTTRSSARLHGVRERQHARGWTSTVRRVHAWWMTARSFPATCANHMCLCELQCSERMWRSKGCAVGTSQAAPAPRQALQLWSITCRRRQRRARLCSGCAVLMHTSHLRASPQIQGAKLLSARLADPAAETPLRARRRSLRTTYPPSSALREGLPSGYRPADSVRRACRPARASALSLGCLRPARRCMQQSGQVWIVKCAGTHKGLRFSC